MMGSSRLAAGLFVALTISLVSANADTQGDSRNSCPETDWPSAILIPHEYDCSRYYACLGEGQVPMQCGVADSEGNRLHFDPVMQTCVWPVDSNCVSVTDTSSSKWPGSESQGPEGPGAGGPGPGGPGPGGDKPSTPSDGVWTTSESSVTTSQPTDSTEGSSEESEESGEVLPTECPATNDGYAVHIAHEWDCSLFYKCNHGKKVLMQCQPGLWFNAALQLCDWPASSGCVQGTPPPSTTTYPSTGTDPGSDEESEPDTTEAEVIVPTECPATNEGDVVHIAHEWDCSSFYKCNHGKGVLKQCQPGLWFNAVLQLCDWPESSGCVQGTPPPTTTDPSITDEIEWTTSESTNGVTDSGTSEAPSSTTEAEVIIPTECPASNGGYAIHIAHAYDCSLFYQCDHGRKLLRSCAPGLEFNAVLQLCDWPKNAQCVPGIPPTSTTVSSSPAEPTVTAPGPGQGTTTTTTEAVVVIPTECPATNEDHVVHIAHGWNCSLFYKCNHGEKLLLECAPGLEFNAALQLCDWPQNAQCIPGSPPPTTTESSSPDATTDSSPAQPTTPSTTAAPVIIPTECPATNEDYVVHIAHGWNCSLFYKCNHGKKWLMECTSGLEFNAALQLCDWPENAQCVPGTPPPTTTESSSPDDATVTDSGPGQPTTPSTTEAPVIIPTECPPTNEGYVVHIAHGWNCSLFYKCNHGQKYLMECISGLEFNAALQLCDWPANAQCIPGTPPTTTTESITTDTDSDSSTPDDTTEVEVIIPTECPPTNDGDAVHIAHGWNCSLFYQCNNGEKLLMECAPGLEFNAALQLCDWPENAQCISGTPPPTTTESIPTAPDSGSPTPDTTEAEMLIPTECPRNNEGFAVNIAHESDCGSYYQCDNGRKLLRQCVPGLSFNAAIQTCDWPENAGCVMGYSDDSGRLAQVQPFY